MASFKHSDIEYLFTYRKTRIAYENLAERMLSGQSQGVAANNTGIELTRAAEVIKHTNLYQQKLKYGSTLNLLN